MRLYEFIESNLNEGLSSVLYHFTSFENAIDAIEANNMFGEDSLSLTRSIAGEFHRNSYEPGVLFKINGRKLSYTNKGSPVGGWEYDSEVDDKVRSNPIYKKREIAGELVHYSSGKEGQFEEQIYKQISDLKAVTELIYVFVPVVKYLSDSIGDINNFYELASSHRYSVKFILGVDMLNASGAKSMSFEQFVKYCNANNLTESSYKFSSKTGQMEYDNSDPDQRHGIYINNKLIQTFNTKDEADNVVKRDRRFANGVVKKIVPN